MKRISCAVLLALCGAAGSLFADDRHAGALRGEGYSVSERELHVDNQARKRSGHMGHALIDCGRGRILAFNSNCDQVRSAGHSGYGWMEYRISTDYGRTFGPVRTLGYSRRLYEEGRHTAICEKGVCLADGRIVLFFQITDASKDICCEPWSAPTMAVSTDGGETFSDGIPTGADPGRIYDALVHDGRVYFITMANDASTSFLGNAPEHVYKLWSAGPDLKFVPTVLPFDSTGRAYCTMDFAANGALHVYVYNSKCETRVDCAVSRDLGKTWSPLKSAAVSQKIRCPQVRRLGDRWFLFARNGGEGDGLVLYSSRDGFAWDGGLKVDERPAGGKTAYCSCLLPVLEPGKPQRMLLQYSHVYGTKPADCNCVNVIHRWITPDGDLHLVLPDEGPGTGRKEFCDLWRRMTGREPVVVKESEFAGEGRAVWLGDTERAKAAGAGNAVLKREEIVVKTLPEGGVLVNGRNAYGLMSAMYEFFEGLGCRWYDAWNRVLPKRAMDEPFPRFDIRRTPSFLYRHLFTAEDDPNTCQWDHFPHRNEYAWRESESPLSDRFYGSPGAVHSFWDYMEDWGTNHVDWLSIDEKGRPRKLTGRVGPCFCFSHPGPREDFRRKLLGHIAADRARAAAERRDPPVVYVLSQNDATKYFCKCPKCAKISNERGESALLLDFINDLADTVKEKYPDVYLYAEAYGNAEPPPKDGTRPRDNVMMEYSRTKGTYYLPVEEDRTSETGGKESYEELMRWKDLAKTLCIWDYWVFYWDRFPAAYHNIHFIGRNIRFYHSIGVRVARFESEAAETCSFHALRKYLAYKLMDDVTRDENAIIDDFLKGYYGPAAPEMRELLDYIAKRQEGSRMTVFRRGIYAANAAAFGKPREWLDVEFHKKTNDIFERALAKLPAKCMWRVNVNRERIPCDLSIIHRYTELKPPVSIDELVDRYVSCAKQQAKLHHRKNLEAFLRKIEDQGEMLRHAEEIAATKKNPPRRELKVADWPKWTEMTDWYENAGFKTDRKLSLKLSRKPGNVLVVKMREDGIDYPVVPDRVNGTGDDFEIFLGNPQSSYVQVLIAPNGNFATYVNGHEQKIDSIRVTADFAADRLEAVCEIPLDALPVKNIRYGNFMRCSSGFECAWSPTLCGLRQVTGRFGLLTFGEGAK